MITIAIPVGPDRTYQEYLQECLDSIKEQTIAPDEILLIDDMAGLFSWGLDLEGLSRVRLHENPWLCGVPHSFNFGVSLAQNELVIMLGSDDKLYPWAIEDALKTWAANQVLLGYYYFDIEYSDNGETQSAANNCAMVTKSLWEHTGGFPIQSVVGACDHIFLSMMMAAKGKAGSIIRIESEKPPYWYRRHNKSATAGSNIWPAIEAVKERLSSKDFKSPEWGRYG